MSGDYETVSSAQTTLGGSGPNPVHAFGDLPAPPTTARYQHELVLGTGGTAQVTLCKDRLVGRRVAFKALDPQRAKSANLRARFLREARVQALLEHPAIVPVYTIGRDERGVEYFTMKRITGVTLAKVIAGKAKNRGDYVNRFPRNKLLAILRQLCLAVDYAHARGIVHRDLKPANIMIGDYGEVYILDWGIAKFMRETEEDAPDPNSPSALEGRAAPGLRTQAMTVPGQILGTPGYMAPEQTADAHLVNQLADVYSLGAILFELLTLTPLHRGKTKRELLRSTRKGFTEAPSERAVGMDSPPELDRICLKATAFAPWERYGSARELFEAIDRFIEGERDLELRSDIAARHAAAAETATEEAARSSNPEARFSTAVREAARALTLDPDSPAAQRVLMRVMLEPPPAIPIEVERTLEEEAVQEGRFAALLGVGAYSSFLVALLVIVWTGIRSWFVFAWTFVPLLAAVAFCIVTTRHSWKTRWLNAAPVSFFSALSIGAASGFFGPLVLVPTLAAANTIAINVTNLRRVRWVHLAFGCGTVVVPTLLEWVGWWSPAYAFHDAMLVILPRAVEFSPTMSVAILVVANVLAIVAPALVLWRLSDTLNDLRQRLHLQIWHLEQLVPTAGTGNERGRTPR